MYKIMKRFDDVFGLIRFIHKNKLYPVKKRNIEYGDEYYSEYGVDYIIKIDGFNYSIGYCNVTEDGEDWAQAEGYINAWISKCDDNHNTIEHINSNDMWDMLIVNKRDYLIDLTLKS